MLEESYYANRRPEVVALVPPSTKKLLDVGCGYGALGADARRLGVREIYGIELFADAGRIAKATFDAVAVGDIESMQIPWSGFDCIVCADVLEHTRDPWAVLRKLKNSLAVNGVIVASIPNVAHISVVLKILMDRFEYEDSGILDRTHLRFFTKHTIEQLFSSTGFTIQTIDYVRTDTLKHKLMRAMSFGLLRPYSIFQFLIVAKHAERQSELVED
jgi:2-polyprenyl-3-methyl-5-hydroxy-6-metoxy-1,4-benzoquinol methylase